MSIPALDPTGWLPPGEHECDFDELRERFGSDTSTPIRQQLVRALRSYLTSPYVERYAESLLIDGSFVSSKRQPGDIDLVPVLPAGTLLSLPGDGVDPAKVIRGLTGYYAPRLSGKQMIHGFIGEIGTHNYRHWLKWFQQSDRAGEPDKKGILRLPIGGHNG